VERLETDGRTTEAREPSSNKQLGLVSQELLDDEGMAALREVALQHEMWACVHGTTEPATLIASAGEE
jgi:hypothetical protein